MTVSDRQIERYFEVLGRTRVKKIAREAAGFSRAWYADRQKKDKAFRDRTIATIADLDTELSSKIVDVVRYGAPYETLDREGNVIVLRKYCKATTIAFAERFLGWSDRGDDDDRGTKEVQLIGSDGKPVSLLAQLQAGVAKDKGVKIIPAPAPKEENEEPEE